MGPSPTLVITLFARQITAHTSRVAISAFFFAATPFIPSPLAGLAGRRHLNTPRTLGIYPRRHRRDWNYAALMVAMLPVAVAMLPTTGPGADRSSTDSARSVERKHQSAPPKQMEKPHANAAPEQSCPQ